MGAREASRVADQLKYRDAASEVALDPTMPPAAISGWTPAVVDSPPGTFGMLSLDDPAEAWTAASKVENAAEDFLPGGPFNSRAPGLVTVRRPELPDFGGSGPGFVGRQGILVKGDASAPHAEMAAMSPMLVAAAALAKQPQPTRQHVEPLYDKCTTRDCDCGV